MPSWFWLLITVSRSLLLINAKYFLDWGRKYFLEKGNILWELHLRLFPVTETVTSTGLIATAAAAVNSAIPARGAISSARGLARLGEAPPPFLSAAAEICRNSGEGIS